MKWSTAQMIRLSMMLALLSPALLRGQEPYNPSVNASYDPTANRTAARDYTSSVYVDSATLKANGPGISRGKTQQLISARAAASTPVAAPAPVKPPAFRVINPSPIAAGANASAFAHATASADTLAPYPSPAATHTPGSTLGRTSTRLSGRIPKHASRAGASRGRIQGPGSRSTDKAQ